jgi:hypothetical protein
MNKLTNLFKSIDTYGQEPSFYIDGQTKLNSATGGVLSLLLILIPIVATIFFGQELLLKEKPTTNTSSSFNSKTGSFEFFKDIDFFIGVRDHWGPFFINERIFRAEAEIMRWSNETQVTTTIPLKVEACRDHAFNPDNFKVLKDLEWQNAYCIARNQSEEVYIQAQYNTHQFSSVNIYFRRCVIWWTV